VIYLDTHCAIWAACGEWFRFSPLGVHRMENEEVRLSPIVRLELKLLYEIGRLTLEPLEILRKAEEKVGATMCEKPFDDVMMAASWLAFTRDPFDRMLCAHALAGGGDLLTKDEKLLRHFPNAVW